MFQLLMGIQGFIMAVDAFDYSALSFGSRSSPNIETVMTWSRPG